MIGRENEIKTLRAAYESDHSEFVAVYGRRRIGKTFLINEVFNYKFAFHAAGMENATRKVQLSAFREALKKQGHPQCPRLSSWIVAFSELETMLEKMPAGKKIVFLDELPWFDTPCSGFLNAFELFWNGWATSRRDILLIICGSATTWVVNEVLRSRGGLHNRVTRQIPLVPFTLKECEAYANYKNLGFDRRQIMECYMTLGGVAYYWSLLQEGQSAAQNIDRLFFGTADEMRNEFSRLFSSLFKSSARHVEIVKALGGKKSGMSREEIVSAVGLKDSGKLSRILEELEESGFIRIYSPLGRVKRGSIYQLVDAFTLFHLTFMRGKPISRPGYWLDGVGSGERLAWEGVAFERVCMWHEREIKVALGIAGVSTTVCAWRSARRNGGAQIDMLIDRRDGVINVCEVKFVTGEFPIGAKYARELENKLSVLKEETQTDKSLHLTMITASGIKRNEYSYLVHSQVRLDDLFRI